MYRKFQSDNTVGQDKLLGWKRVLQERVTCSEYGLLADGRNDTWVK
jgi:hypothetical protein